VDTRALKRLSLIVGILILIGSIIAVRQFRTEDSGLEVLLIAGLAIGGLLLLSGLFGVISEPPMTEEEEEAALAAEQVASGRPMSVSTAMGLYLLVLSVLAGIVVGVASGDLGFGIQAFTFGLILSGVVYGLGVLLGYRPAEE
jgi:hypothetical protein